MLELQAGHILCNFFFRDVALAQLKNLHQFIYVIIFGLTRFGTATLGRTCLVLGASRKWHHCQAISHVYGLVMLVM